MRRDELYHHGIKKQKWGVRRFQNEDGSLTPRGKERYNDTPNAQIKKSKHRLKLEQRCKELGMTDEQAQATANNKIRTEKILAVSAGVAVTAAVATYVASKVAKRKCNGVMNEFFEATEDDWKCFEESWNEFD